MDVKPNIVIVVWDAVRAKNLPFYGYERNTTPYLLNMEQDLTIYRNAISSSYWTLPSITSLFTGMYSSAHGLVLDGDTLNSDITTLPEILQQEGYYCAAFNRNPYVSSFTGLDRGFDHFVSDSKSVWDYLKKLERKLKKKFSKDPSFQPAEGQEMKSVRDGSTAAKVLKHFPDIFIDSGSGGLLKLFSNHLKKMKNRPFCAFFQAIETHSPYRAPLKFGFEFLSVGDLFRKLLINQDHLGYVLGQNKITGNQFRILRGAYDNAIQYCDFVTHQICELLKASGLYDNTLLIVMSDHGESIGEHNLMFHIWSLYDNLIKVPLVVKYPKDITTAQQVDKIVQNVDIFPTICSLLNIKSPSQIEQAQGNSMLDETIINREADIAVSELIKPFGPDTIAYREHLPEYDRRLLSLRTAGSKFIYSSNGEHEYYDLSLDSEEAENLYGKCTGYDGIDERAKFYFQKMDTFYQANRIRIEGEEAPNIENEEIKEKLKQLGYL
jgi:arylsulfatase A-like enzyme